MEQQPLPPQQPLDPLATNVGFMPQQKMNMDSMMSKHLDASDILDRLKNMLMGLEYDEEEDEWKPVMITVGYNEKGEALQAEEGPLMEPRDVRITISFLLSFLNSNTFLSQIDNDRINDIMWDVNKKLSILFYNLRDKLTPSSRDMIWSMIEYPILLGLSRANKKITLDAVSKTQQTHELIQGNPSTPTPDSKKFNILGW